MRVGWQTRHTPEHSGGFLTLVLLAGWALASIGSLSSWELIVGCGLFLLVDAVKNSWKACVCEVSVLAVGEAVLF